MRNVLLAVAVSLVALAAAGDRLLVRIHLSYPEEVQYLDDLGLDFASEAPTADRDAIVTESELAAIRSRGFRVDVVRHNPTFVIPAEYHDYFETFAVFDSLQSLYPGILRIDTVGWSLWQHDPIWGIRISDNPSVEEDEPALLYTGVTHAREPLGCEILVHLARYLCANYVSSAQVRRWVDSLDIWLVPILNVDGYQFMFDSAQTYPYWRKNQRDNNNNGRFDRNYDGVDLNRNFDWRWTVGGSTTPSSETYRGPYAGSESEVQAWCALSRRELPVFGISYHSYGEVVMYPWRYQGLPTPDEDALQATAQRMAQLIGYTVSTTSGSNMSSDWLYARTGQLDVLIETYTDEFIPEPGQIPVVCADNFHADTFLFNRVFYSAICGHVRDAVTDSALVAEVQVLGRVDTALDPRLSDSVFGRYWRVLVPGVYGLRFIADGYETLTRTGLRVGADSLTHFEARLQRLTGIAQRPSAARCPDLRVVPNPFVSCAAVPGRELERFELFDVNGRVAGTFPGTLIGAGLAPGVYFLEAGDRRFRLVKLSGPKNR
ncbi:hypothetical protein FJY71_01150 [candidate division WOR-3 bacterium]|nr:hypothetical protein [candidate division WOR-3 bacterium]